MSLLVVGSVAFDGIETPFGKVEKTLGGAASYFALAASHFTPVRVVGIVGDDFTARETSRFSAGATSESISKASNMLRANRFSGRGVTTRT